MGRIQIGLACAVAGLSLFAGLACGGSGGGVNEEGAVLLREALTATGGLDALSFQTETTVSANDLAAAVVQNGRRLDGDRLYVEISRPGAPLIEVATVAGAEYERHTGSDWQCYINPSVPLTNFGYNPPNFGAYSALIDQAESVSSPDDVEVDGRELRRVEIRLEAPDVEALALVYGALDQLVMQADSAYSIVFLIDADGRVAELSSSTKVDEAKIEAVQRFNASVPTEDFPLATPYPAC